MILSPLRLSRYQDRLYEYGYLPEGACLAIWPDIKEPVVGNGQALSITVTETIVDS